VHRDSPVELVENDAGLNARGTANRVDVEDLVEVLAAVDDEPSARVVRGSTTPSGSIW